MTYEKNYNSFSLSETLITVVLLGIVAAILVPNLIKNQVENANRTKVKKAMASYEKAINYMIIENDIRSTESLRELGQNNCQYTREYFKTVKDGATNCIFKTADRVWWNITDITNPILILKEDQRGKDSDELLKFAKDVDNQTIFAMVGRFDDLGTLRVNDNAYEQANGTTNQRNYVGKLWYFITQSPSVLIGIQKCQVEGAATCTVTNNGVSVTYTKIITTHDIVITEDQANHRLRTYDRETKSIKDNSSIAAAGYYWISDDLGKLSEEEAKDMTGSVCKTQDCLDNGDYYEAAKRRCDKNGGHLASLAELEIARNSGKISSDNWYWASEEPYSSGGYILNGSTDNVSICLKYGKAQKFLCVGN